MSGTPWRVVEAQHIFATRKLVDSVEEQELLEELIEAGKPELRPSPHRSPRPESPQANPPEAVHPGGVGMHVDAHRQLHYLLSTPFRYPPLRFGSRLGTRMERGIWYGAEEVRTVLAETAYYRLLFISGTQAQLGTIQTRHTLFRAKVATDRGADLTERPYKGHRAAIASPTDYSVGQALGSAMREAGVEAVRYPSARDAEGGANVAVFSPRAFTRRTPMSAHDWVCFTQVDRVEFRKLDRLKPTVTVFPREQFLVDGVLPSPAV